MIFGTEQQQLWADSLALAWGHTRIQFEASCKHEEEERRTRRWMRNEVEKAEQEAGEHDLQQCKPRQRHGTFMARHHITLQTACHIPGTASHHVADSKAYAQHCHGTASHHITF
eukprot:1161214-Pelagomonas_calceolata.AAC.15